MARNKTKKAEVEIKEAPHGKDDDRTELEILINGQSIGKVIEEDNHTFEAHYHTGSVRKLKTMDEGVEFILMEYNLHEMR